MAVPNTTTFNLRNVTTELNLGNGDGLWECFDEAVDGDFDPVYSGSKDNLLNFRNYNAVVRVSYSDYNLTAAGQYGFLNQGVTLSSSLSVGNLILIAIQAEANVDVTTPPSGYTFITSKLSSSAYQYLYYKVAVAADIGAVVSAMTYSSASGSRYRLMSYTIVENQHLSFPVADNTTFTTSSSPVSTGLTGLTEDSLVLFWNMVTNTSSVVTYNTATMNATVASLSMGGTNAADNRNYTQSSDGAGDVSTISYTGSASLTGIALEILNG